LPALGRILICLIFIQGAMGKLFGWDGQATYMARHGISPIAPLLAAALVVEVVGIVCLLLGYQARIAALIMAGYLFIVSVLLHDFWKVPGGGMAKTEFFKNMGIMGGLLMIAAYGPGEWSLGHLLQRKK
jgi:putative oxidoreductase